MQTLFRLPQLYKLNDLTAPAFFIIIIFMNFLDEHSE